MLAIRAGVPLVPLCICGAFERTPKGVLNVRPGQVVIRVGEPIQTRGMTYDDRDGLSVAARASITAMAVR